MSKTVVPDEVLEEVAARFALLADASGRNGTWAAVPIPLVVRLPAGVALIAWGARADRRWTVLVGSMLGLPALWYGSLAMLLAVITGIEIIAVYIPIGFQGGLTGALFTEFAFTLVGAVTISGVVALTLSPMLCSRLLKPHAEGRGSWEQRTST